MLHSQFSMILLRASRKVCDLCCAAAPAAASSVPRQFLIHRSEAIIKFKFGTGSSRYAHGGVEHEVDLYAVLGLQSLGPKATVCDVKKAYRSCALAWHPDKQVGKPPNEVAAAAVKFETVPRAKEVLGSENSKRIYDYRRGSPTGREARFDIAFNWSNLVMDLCDIEENLRDLENSINDLKKTLSDLEKKNK